MSFTRFHDDPARIQKKLEEMTAIGQYQLNVPGNGVNMNYVEDPHIRLEKWGANLSSNSIDIENDLRGQTRLLNRDITHYDNHNVVNKPINYGTTKGSVEQSRATHPAWELRDVQQKRFDDLPFDPQAHVVLPFHSNLQTRILEKDYYKKKY
mgnify:FL=1|jgi:hypothetical protein|tara:strand:+ start:2708 stop:3163 length:456 start_codon:yes stop_codon:yes gene_type:complete